MLLFHQEIVQTWVEDRMLLSIHGYFKCEQPLPRVPRLVSQLVELSDQHRSVPSWSAVLLRASARCSARWQGFNRDTRISKFQLKTDAPRHLVERVLLAWPDGEEKYAARETLPVQIRHGFSHCVSLSNQSSHLRFKYWNHSADRD